MTRREVAAIDAFEYRLPLVRPLVMPSGTHTERRGLLIRLTAADGAEGWGEAAPLPGYSPDTLGDVRQSLGAWAQGAAVPFGSPAAQWAIVQAASEIEAARRSVPLAEVYADRLGRTQVATTVALNALVLGDASAVVASAREAVAAGYAAVKLKVGGAPADAAARVHAVANVLGSASLRLDANGAWSLADALAFARAVDGVAIEYLEEPLSDPSQLSALARDTTIAWALDESLHQAVDQPALAAALGGAVVKPTLGPDLVEWAVRALSGDDRTGSVVVSSTFESGVGMRHLVALAAALGETPAGLDTYRWLAADVLDRPLPISGPRVDVAALLAPNAVRLDVLTPISLP